MGDWDANSAQLEQNLLHLLETARDHARRRTVLSVEVACEWHTEVLRNLEVPDPRYVGRFRGEAGLEKVQVHIGARFGVAARDVRSALDAFERIMQRVVARLDILIRRNPRSVRLGPRRVDSHPPVLQRQWTYGAFVGQQHRHAL